MHGIFKGSEISAWDFLGGLILGIGNFFGFSEDPRYFFFLLSPLAVFSAFLWFFAPTMQARFEGFYFSQ